MAEDRLMFPIGFSLDDAVKAAEKDFGKVIKDLQEVAEKKPLQLKVETDLKSIGAAKGSISALREEMAKLSKAWNSMTNLEKFDGNKLTGEAQELVKQYAIATESLEKYGLTLEQIIRQEKQRAAEAIKNAENERVAHQRLQQTYERLFSERNAVKGIDIGFKDTTEQIQLVRTLNQQYESLIAKVNSLSKKRTDVDIQIDKQAEAEIDNLTKQINQLGQAMSKAGQRGGIVAVKPYMGAIDQLKSKVDELNQTRIELKSSNEYLVKIRELQEKTAGVYSDLRKAESNLSADNRVNEALGAKLARVNELKQGIRELDAQYARLQATEGGTSVDNLSREAGNILRERIRLENELKSITQTAGEAQIALQRKIEQNEKEWNRERERQNKARLAEEKRLREEAERTANARRQAWQKLRGTLQAEENSIANINAKLQIYRQRMQSAEIDGRQFAQSAKQVERLSKKLQEANNRVAQLTGQTVAGQRRMTSAVNETNRAYSSTEGYISRLLRRTAVLFGIHQVARFTERLRETTAEFELQRVSLGAIIQDTERANALFNQIKTFAVQSPFEIKDLVGYVKQLSAYRIETDKLFDTTKRLADVSAGLGVDMGRLILAYGQVKAASVLRGSEVRQFTEAGIPLIESLAEKFTALRGEMVSTGEVFDLISQRAVSFEMVAEIFEDMTNAGGMFYNMQEKQAATLAGQWSNLKDSLSIMYDEMGNTSGVWGAMEGMISLVKTLAENWRDVRLVAYEVFGGVVLSKSIGIFKSFIQLIRKDAISAIRQQIIAQKEYNAAIKAEGNILATATAEEKAAAAARVTSAKATRDAAVATAQAARSTNVLTMAWRKFTAVLKSNWVGIALAALVALVNYIVHAVRKTNELKNALADIEREGGKNMEVMAQSFERLAKRAVEAADGSKEQREALEELQRTYKDMIPTHQLTIENLRKLEGNYSSLTDAVRGYAEANIYAQKVEAVIANTQEKVLDLQSDIRDKLKGGLEYADMAGGHQITNLIQFSDSEINQIFGRVKYYAQNTSDDIRTILKNAIEDIDKDIPKSALNSFLSINKFKKIIEEYRKEGEELKKLEDNFYTAENVWGKYGKAIDKATDAINEWKNANKDLQATSPFDFNKQLLEQSGKEYRKAIEKIIDDANKGISADKKIRLNEDWFSGEYIDTTAILKTLEKAGLDISSQAYKSVEKIQTAYMQFVPSNEFIKAINGKFEQIGRSMGDNVLNVINQDLMNADEGINDFVERFFDTLDSLKLQVKQKGALLKSGDVTGENRKAEEESLRRLKIRLEAHEKMVSYMEQYRMQQERGGGGDNADIQRLKLMVSLLEKVYTKYKDYLSIMSQSEAQAKINDYFGETLGLFEKYSISLPRTAREFQAALRILQAEAERLGDTQLVQQLGYKWGDVDFSETKSDIESELKRLADEVSRTKTAKEFFDKMLNLTGDQELSATVTMSVYGAKGDDLKRKLIDQIRNAFGTTTGEELDLSLAINYNTLEVDYLKLAQIAEENKGILLEASKATRDGIIKNGLETTAARVMQWEKDIQTDQTYSEKRIRLAQETAARIADIEVSNIPESEKKRLKEGYQQREKAQAADLAWSAFKDSPIYVQMFDKLETASTTMLNAMLDKLKQLKSQWGESLSPTELKELQSRMNEIEAQLANKNPFKTLASAIKEYRALTKGKSYNQAVQELAENMSIADIESGKYAESLRLAQAAEQKYTEALKQHGDGSEEANNARLAADIAWEQARAQQKIADNAKKVADKSQNTVDAYKECADNARNAASAIGEWTGKLNEAFDGIRNIMDAFGASDEDMQFFDDLVGGFNKVSQGAQQGAMAVASFMSGNILGGITGAIGSIGNIVSGVTDIFYAGRVKRANKEIKKQQKILDSLEHSYDRLQKAADSLFGSEYVANFHKQQKNLKAQIAATEKQLAAERSKGSKKDDEKVKQYEEQIQSLKDELEDMQGKLAEHMLGTDLASAARSFAQAWLDAYKEFGDTRKAIEGEMEDMMQNLIQEAVFGAVMQNALKDLYKFIDESDPSDMQDEKFWKTVNEMYHQAIEYMDTGASVTAGWMEELGMLSRDLGDDFTGISKDIATASEESILGLSSLINTSLFYVSNIDRNVAQITALLGGGMDLSSNEQLIDIFTIQNQHLAYLPNIALNTAQTAERCERAAAACENIAENLNRVIKPNGVQGSYRVNTSL